MKITKTLFKTEIVLKPYELRRFRDFCTPEQYVGLFWWIKKTFGIDVLPKHKKS